MKQEGLSPVILFFFIGGIIDYWYNKAILFFLTELFSTTYLVVVGLRIIQWTYVHEKVLLYKGSFGRVLLSTEQNGWTCLVNSLDL